MTAVYAAAALLYSLVGFIMNAAALGADTKKTML